MMAAPCFGSRADSAAPCLLPWSNCWKTPAFPHALPGCITFPSLLSQALNSLVKLFNSFFFLSASLGSIIAAAAEITKSALGPAVQPLGSTDPPLCQDVLSAGQLSESRAGFAWL